MSEKRQDDKLSKEKTDKSDSGRAATQRPLLPWMSTGMAYRSSDFDADDVYIVTCKVNGSGDLAVQFDGTAGDGKFVCAAAAIESGSEKIHIAQGGASLSQDNGDVDEKSPTQAFPPFLLSRSLFAALKAGEAIAWPTVLTGDGKTVAVKKTGAGTAKIVVNGKKETVSTIEAQGSDVTLVVLDDEAWPLVLVDDEADECGWWLRAVGKDLDADEVADSAYDDDEEDEDDEDDEDGEGGWRRFEMDEKFWAILLDGDRHTVKFGKIGTDGQEKSKSFDDEEAAKKDYDKLIKEKTGKGYEEVDADADA